ncbi:MAG TPA: cyclopropane-fatty-acyl-phospholipid synthase family protein [Candidatus Acidoferrales bacterium]|nr:cyclopropane-fatty-acyl-phospholipid synthase family protein [Candidatus Acidoferrales bacterium]
MAVQSAPATQEHQEIALCALRELFGPAFVRNFAVRLWDGTYVEAREQPPRFVFAVNDPSALRAAIARPIDLAAGRAFAAGLISIEGDLEAAVDELYAASEALTPMRGLRILGRLRRLPKPEMPALREASLRGRAHSRARDRQAIAFHYDLPVAFYRTFLDPELVYSCAYFDDGVETLAEAQVAKLRYLCRKLRLRAGERLLDIGCGWGSLVVEAAKSFGANVLGITLSSVQCERARERIAEAGVADRATVELRDYRELGDLRFDKIVSVGMFEHVGRSKLREYFDAAYRALRPGGLFMNHGIAHQTPGLRSGRATGFMERFIFPDGELVQISDALGVAEASGFEVRDVENLREHYTRTLRAWVANLEAGEAAAIAAGGEQAYRAWRLYLAGSAQGFRSGRLGLYQSLLARRDAEGRVEIPPTRRDLYGAPA